MFSSLKDKRFQFKSNECKLLDSDTWRANKARTSLIITTDIVQESFWCQENLVHYGQRSHDISSEAF